MQIIHYHDHQQSGEPTVKHQHLGNVKNEHGPMRNGSYILSPSIKCIVSTDEEESCGNSVDTYFIDSGGDRSRLNTQDLKRDFYQGLSIVDNTICPGVTVKNSGNKVVSWTLFKDISDTKTSTGLIQPLQQTTEFTGNNRQKRILNTGNSELSLCTEGFISVITSLPKAILTEDVAPCKSCDKRRHSAPAQLLREEGSKMQQSETNKRSKGQRRASIGTEEELLRSLGDNRRLFHNSKMSFGSKKTQKSDAYKLDVNVSSDDAYEYYDPGIFPVSSQVMTEAAATDSSKQKEKPGFEFRVEDFVYDRDTFPLSVQGKEKVTLTDSSSKETDETNKQKEKRNLDFEDSDSDIPLAYLQEKLSRKNKTCYTETVSENTRYFKKPKKSKYYSIANPCNRNIDVNRNASQEVEGSRKSFTKVNDKDCINGVLSQEKQTMVSEKETRNSKTVSENSDNFKKPKNYIPVGSNRNSKKVGHKHSPQEVNEDYRIRFFDEANKIIISKQGSSQEKKTCNSENDSKDSDGFKKPKNPTPNGSNKNPKAEPHTHAPEKVDENDSKDFNDEICILGEWLSQKKGNNTCKSKTDPGNTDIRKPKESTPDVSNRNSKEEDHNHTPKIVEGSRESLSNKFPNLNGSSFQEKQTVSEHEAFNSKTVSENSEDLKKPKQSIPNGYNENTKEQADEVFRIALSEKIYKIHNRFGKNGNQTIYSKRIFKNSDDMKKPKESTTDIFNRNPKEEAHKHTLPQVVEGSRKRLHEEIDKTSILIRGSSQKKENKSCNSEKGSENSDDSLEQKKLTPDVANGYPEGMVHERTVEIEDSRKGFSIKISSQENRIVVSENEASNLRTVSENFEDFNESEKSRLIGYGNNHKEQVHKCTSQEVEFFRKRLSDETYKIHCLLEVSSSQTNGNKICNSRTVSEDYDLQKPEKSKYHNYTSKDSNVNLKKHAHKDTLQEVETSRKKNKSLFEEPFIEHLHPVLKHPSTSISTEATEKDMGPPQTKICKCVHSEISDDSNPKEREVTKLGNGNNKKSKSDMDFRKALELKKNIGEIHEKTFADDQMQYLKNAESNSAPREFTSDIPPGYELSVDTSTAPDVDDESLSPSGLTIDLSNSDTNESEKQVITKNDDDDIIVIKEFKRPKCMPIVHEKEIGTGNSSEKEEFEKEMKKNKNTGMLSI